MVLIVSDGSALSVYMRPNHVPPESTTVTFIVADIDGSKVAWFKDPDGNIPALTPLPQAG
jgi:hypothetical protein